MPGLRSVELYRNDQCRLLAIEAVAFHQRRFDHGGQLFGSVTPLVVVVCRPGGNEVMTVAEDSDELEKLKRQHPELEDMIARVCS